MTTIINNPNGNENSGTGVVVGVLVALLIIVLVLIFGLPYLRNKGAPVPDTSTQSGTSVNVQIP